MKEENIYNYDAHGFTIGSLVVRKNGDKFYLDRLMGYLDYRTECLSGLDSKEALEVFMNGISFVIKNSEFSEELVQSVLKRFTQLGAENDV
jgi:hypothetical protein